MTEIICIQDDPIRKIRDHVDFELGMADYLLQAALDVETRAEESTGEEEMQNRLASIRELLVAYRERVNRIIETMYGGEKPAGAAG